MRVLTVSDKVEESFFKEHLLREKCDGVRLILACGDLPSYYLEYLLNSLNVPLYYVPGNHDEEIHLKKKPFASGCESIDERVIAFKGWLFGGLGGAFHYRNGKYLYTEKQMQRKARRMIPRMALNKIKYKRYLDILITHAPPFGIHDERTLAHQGFETFLKFMRTYKPAYIIHGHTRPDPGKKKSVSHYLSTRIINTNNYRVLDLVDASIR
jgi:Icc-related predicted phosphoesterase